MNDLCRPQDFSIDCANCSITGEFSLSAGGSIAEYTIDTPQDVTELHPDFNFTNFWVGATFDSLDAYFEFDLNLTNSTTQNQLVVPISSDPISKSVCLPSVFACWFSDYLVRTPYSYGYVRY